MSAAVTNVVYIVNSNLSDGVSVNIDPAVAPLCCFRAGDFGGPERGDPLAQKRSPFFCSTL